MDVLMSGLTILSQKTEVITDFNWLAFIISAIIVIVLSIAIGHWTDEASAGVLFAVLMLFLSLITVWIFSPEIPTGKTIYKVTVSDTVSMNDFNEKYNVLSQEGLIYEIVEKDVE